MSDNNQDTTAGLLTKRDFMVACQALAETHNRYLEAFNSEETLHEYSKEEMEHAVQNTHATFVKFQAILMSTVPPEEGEEIGETEDADEDTHSVEEE